MDSARGGPAARRRGPVVDKGVELVVGDHTVDEAVGQPPPRRSTCRRRSQLLGLVQADEPRQQPRRAAVERKAALGEDLRQPGDRATMRSQPRARLRPGPAAIPGSWRWWAWGRWQAQRHVTEPRIGTRYGTPGRRPVGVRCRHRNRRRRRHRSRPGPGRRVVAPPRRRWRSSSCHMGPLPAFLRSGRFSVTVTTPSSRSTMMVSVASDTIGQTGRSQKASSIDLERTAGPDRHARRTGSLGPRPAAGRCAATRGQPPQRDAAWPGSPPRTGHRRRCGCGS